VDDLLSLLSNHVKNCPVCSDDSLTGDAAKCDNFNKILADFKDE